MHVHANGADLDATIDTGRARKRARAAGSEAAAAAAPKPSAGLAGGAWLRFLFRATKSQGQNVAR